MKIKVALGVVASLSAIILNTIPTEKDAKMVIENKTIYESDEVIAEIKDELEDEPVESKAEIKQINPQLKINLKKSSNVENHTENEPENVNPDSNPPQEKTYVEGFGYVEASGPAIIIQVHSNGDINKQVGTMD